MREELENRLIDFTVAINGMVYGLKAGLLSQTIGLQIIRSATSATLNFGEAQGAESRRDFIHKMNVVLKELRETEISLKIILRSNQSENEIILITIIEECKQLVAIFQKSLNTARKNIKTNLNE
jgi:four helix bundle protein